jgi:hypothetical protein
MIDYEDFTSAALRSKLEDRRLPKHGSKPELVERLEFDDLYKSQENRLLNSGFGDHQDQQFTSSTPTTPARSGSFNNAHNAARPPVQISQSSLFNDDGSTRGKYSRVFDISDDDLEKMSNNNSVQRDEE